MHTNNLSWNGQVQLVQVQSVRRRGRRNLLVRIHFIIVMIRWTGLAPWEFEFPLLAGRFNPYGGGGGEGKQQQPDRLLLYYSQV